MKEKWKSVSGYEGYYEVSNLGRLQSLDRMIVDKVGRKRSIGGKMLKLCLNSNDHYHATLSKGNRRVSKKIHQLVAEAFIGPRPIGCEVCHNNGQPLDNEVGNLRYDTSAGNQADRLKHGTSNRGEKNGRAKLNEGDVREIRLALCGGKTRALIAKKFGVSEVQISKINGGKCWSHIL